MKMILQSGNNTSVQQVSNSGAIAKGAMASGAMTSGAMARGVMARGASGGRRPVFSCAEIMANGSKGCSSCGSR